MANDEFEELLKSLEVDTNYSKPSLQNESPQNESPQNENPQNENPQNESPQEKRVVYALGGLPVQEPVQDDGEYSIEERESILDGNRKDDLPSKRVPPVKNLENSVFKDADHSLEYSNYLMSSIHPRMGFKEDEEDIENAEKEYIDAYLDYESEMKEAKQRFKNISMEFAARGVNVRFVNKTIRQIARDSKKQASVAKEEYKIASRLYNNKDLITKICSVLN